MRGRETAWRLLADEITSAREEERGEGERAATYLLTPLGGRPNRVLVAGRIDPAEPAGPEGGPAFYRARFSDPTGSFTVTAGSFQPRALTALRGITSASDILLVGKPHLFQGRDGTRSVSVRAEDLRPATEEEIRSAWYEAGRQTLRRLELARRLAAAPETPDATLRAEGFPLLWVSGARAALRGLGALEPDRYLGTLPRLLGAPAVPAAPAAPPPSPAPVRGGTPTGPARATPARPVDHAQEAIFLDLLDELVESSDDGFAELREVERRAAARGLSEERVEELLGTLEADGVLEEPIVGKIRRAGA